MSGMRKCLTANKYIGRAAFCMVPWSELLSCAEQTAGVRAPVPVFQQARRRHLQALVMVQQAVCPAFECQDSRVGRAVGARGQGQPLGLRRQAGACCGWRRGGNCPHRWVLAHDLQLQAELLLSISNLQSCSLRLCLGQLSLAFRWWAH